MKTAIRFYSRSGNTKKLADAIGTALGVPAKTVDEALSEPVDLLFLGGAIYGGKIGNPLRLFIETLTTDNVKSVAVFSTAASNQKAHSQIKALLAGKGIELKELSFHCQSKFLFLNRGRPNQQDCARAADYAKKLV